jgi:hypothetical protein
MTKAINYWMAHGVRIPGWVLVRAELTLEAKIVYGVLLDSQVHWRNKCIVEERPTNTHPLLDADRICSKLKWKQQTLIDAVKELTDFGLVDVGSYETDPEDVRRFELCEHEWATAVLYDVEEGRDGNAKAGSRA